MSVGVERVSKLLTFDGTQEGWFYWSDKFLARADEKGYEEILNGTKKAPKASEVLDPNKDADKVKLREANRNAYGDLIMCISTKTSEGKVAYCAVKGCKTQDLPKGDAEAAWATLKSKYEGKSVPNILSLEEAYANCKLKGKTHPDAWITQMQEMRNRLIDMKTDIPEINFMRHLVNRVPRGYGMQREFLMEKLEQGVLTVEQIKDRLRRRYEEMYGTGTDPLKEGVKDEKDEETALFGFKGKCDSCGEYGHKSKDCPNKKSGNEGTGKRSTFTGKCFVCGKKGHRAFQCRHRKGGNNEQASTAAVTATAPPSNTETGAESDESSDDGYEFVLMATGDDGGRNRTFGLRIQGHHATCATARKVL